MAAVATQFQVFFTSKMRLSRARKRSAKEEEEEEEAGAMQRR